MMSPRARFLVPFLALFFLVAAKQRSVAHPAHPLPQDVYTFSQPDRIRVTHLSLDLTVSFEEKRLRGRATLDLEHRRPGNTQLVLDTHFLQIDRARADGADANWELGEGTNIVGRPLRIDITPTTKKVTIDYVTSNGALGLLWNTAEQSFGRQQPYLYTQNEPIQARSWIPIQDTPTVRMTYDATIRVPRGLLALMSAANPTATNDTGVYTFVMDQTIPAYLISLAVARLEFRALDERTGVYAEPELLEDAAWDLQYIPEMVDVAESIAGPYQFGRYDVLMMPPTYIAGGMEHPRLNFINPISVVTFNRPEPPLPHNLIAHELAHSWAGNQTTLGSWNDVWLNEGITSYLAMRILEEMQPAEHTEFQWARHRAGYAGLVQTSPNTATYLLHTNYTAGQNPGQGFNVHAYTKGELFTKTLEDRIGREEFDAFLKDYFEHFAFRWVDDRNFIEYLRRRVLDQRPGLEAQIKLEEWIYQPGLPNSVTGPTTSALETRVFAEVLRFNAGTAVTSLHTSGWTAVERGVFFELVSPNAVRSRIQEVDNGFGNLSAKTTPPLGFLMHAGYAGHQAAWPAIERYLLRGGGSVVSLYTALASNPAGKQRAIDIFNVAKNRYQQSVANAVAAVLGVQMTNVSGDVSATALHFPHAEKPAAVPPASAARRRFASGGIQ